MGFLVHTLNLIGTITSPLQYFNQPSYFINVSGEKFTVYPIKSYHEIPKTESKGNTKEITVDPILEEVTIESPSESIPTPSPTIMPIPTPYSTPKPVPTSTPAPTQPPSPSPTYISTTSSPISEPTQYHTIAPTQTSMSQYTPVETAFTPSIPKSTPISTSPKSETMQTFIYTPTSTPVSTTISTAVPTQEPVPTSIPTEEPKQTPTPKPVETPTPTPKPTDEPTPKPTPTEEPMSTPKPVETAKPTPKPTEKPTPKPTLQHQQSTRKTLDKTKVSFKQINDKVDELSKHPNATKDAQVVIKSLKYFDVYQESGKSQKSSSCSFIYSFEKAKNIHRISIAPTSDKDHIREFNVQILTGRNIMAIPLNATLPDTYEYVQDFTLPYVFNTKEVSIYGKGPKGSKSCTIPEVAFYGPEHVEDNKSK